MRTCKKDEAGCRGRQKHDRQPTSFVALNPRDLNESLEDLLGRRLRVGEPVGAGYLMSVGAHRDRSAGSGDGAHGDLSHLEGHIRCHARQQIIHFILCKTKDVMGEDIHPRTLHIGQRLAIDENGPWVGDEMGVAGPPGSSRPAGVDGVSFDVRRDNDSDGIFDRLEVAAGSDHQRAASMLRVENGDGVPDVLVGPAGVPGVVGRVGAKELPRSPRQSGTSGGAGPVGSARTAGFVPSGQPD